MTNIRGMKPSSRISAAVADAYVNICCNHLRTHKRCPRIIEIQRLPSAYLLASGTDLGIAQLDDGFMFIGTGYCLNHENPRCDECPISEHCRGARGSRHLIDDYRT